MSELRKTTSLVNLPLESPEYSEVDYPNPDDEFFDNFYDDIFDDSAPSVSLNLSKLSLEGNSNEFSTKSRKQRPKLVNSSVSTSSLVSNPINNLSIDTKLSMVTNTINNIDSNVNSIYNQTSYIYSLIDTQANEIAQLTQEVKETQSLLIKMITNNNKLLNIIDKLFTNDSL